MSEKHVADVLYSAKEPTDLVIVGDNVNTSFEITDDESSFEMTKNDELINFKMGSWESSYVSSIGFVSVITLEEFKSYLKNSEYGLDDEYCIIGDVVGAVLLKKYIGDLELKVKITDENDNVRWAKQGELKSDYIQHQFGYDSDVNIYVNINDSSDAEILDLEKCRQIMKVEERKTENTYHLKVKAYKGEDEKFIPFDKDFYVYLDGYQIAERLLEGLMFKIYPYDDMRVDFKSEYDKEYFDNFNKEKFIKKVQNETGFFEFPKELMDKYDVDCHDCFIIRDDEDDDCDCDDENCQCNQPQVIQGQSLADMLDEAMEEQNKNIQDSKKFYFHLFEDNNIKSVQVVPKPFWDSTKQLNENLWFNPSSKEGIKFKMAGINNKETVKTIYDIIDQDLSLKEIEENILKIDIFEKNDEFSEFVEEELNLEKNIKEKIAKHDYSDFTEEEIEEMEKNVEQNHTMNGKKVNAKVDVNGVKKRPVTYEEIKDLVKNEIENNFSLFYWAKSQETEEKKLEVEEFKGKFLKSSNLEDDEIMFWLDTKTDLPFSINFSENPKGDIISLEDDGDVFTLMMEDKAILIHVEEKMIESMDLRTDEEFQKFLKKVKIYDQDRFKINELAKEYSEEDLKHWIERMSDVGYIHSKSKFQDTGKDEDDYFFIATNKFIRTRKFGFLENEDEKIEDVSENDDEEYFEID